MLNKKIIIGLILLLFLTCGVASAFDLFGDGLKPEDIYIDGFTADVNDCSGENFDYYMYSSYYIINNLSSSFKDAEVVTYFYSNDTLIMDNFTSSLANNSTESVGGTFDDNSCGISAHVSSDTLLNLTHVVIEVVNEGKVIYKETRNVSIKGVGKLTSDYDSDETESSSSSSSGSSGTFVASSNSNKFHEPYCSQAQRISDANKITFSSRDEAINAGYEPCEICYP